MSCALRPLRLAVPPEDCASRLHRSIVFVLGNVFRAFLVEEEGPLRTPRKGNAHEARSIGSNLHLKLGRDVNVKACVQSPECLCRQRNPTCTRRPNR